MRSGVAGLGSTFTLSCCALALRKRWLLKRVEAGWMQKMSFAVCGGSRHAWHTRTLGFDRRPTGS